MTKAQIKKVRENMLAYTDHFGFDIVDTDAIKKCKSEDDFIDVLNGHYKWLEMMLCDASTSIQNFKRENGLI